MKLAIRTLVLALATVSATGCADVASTLAAAAIPSAAPGAPVAGASAAPATTPATTPVNTAASTAPTTPKATEAPVQAMDPEDCKATKADEDKDNGLAKLGGYENQYLPKGWNAAYKNEAEVTAAIDKIKDADWACFQKFYPGATTIYKKRMGA